MMSPPAPTGGRNLALLSLCYALSVTSVAVVVAIAPLIGLALAPRASLATIPASLGVLGVMTASLPASFIMHRIGRRDGFLVGTTIGALGAGACLWAIITADFVLFCLGTAAMGMLNGFAQFYRFAAAEAAPPDARARAIAMVLAGGVAAGLIGPGLAAGTAELGAVRFAGTYVAVVALYAIAAVTLFFVHFAPVEEAVGERPARPLGEITRNARFLSAVVAAMVGYGTMALLMTATPLSMQAAGHSFNASALVIQGHVVAMFAPSFVTGRLIERHGADRVVAAGLALLVGCVLVAVSGQAVWRFWVALVLLGIGWNFLFVAGTTTLTTVHRTNERAKVQGVNDLLVFGSAATGSFLAGYLAARVGWTNLNLVVLPALAVAALVLWSAARTARTTPTSLEP